MNDFLTKLANSSLERQSSEHLKLLGKRAAGIYSSGETTSLNDAVHKVVQDEPLNRDQVSRVTETANQETWKSLFVESGERQVSFEPASAESVIGEMAVKPKEVENHLGELDYSADVPNQRLPDVDLAEVFGVQKGTADYEALNPTSAQQVMVEKTASAVDTSRYAVDNAASMLAEAGETFYKLVKVAHLDEGYGILQVAKAISTIVDDQTFARDVMQKVAERLEKEGVKFNERVELQKVAHPLVVNHQHPIMQAAANLERAAFAHYSADDAHEKLAAAHRLASKTLRDKMRKR